MMKYHTIATPRKVYQNQANFVSRLMAISAYSV